MRYRAALLAALAALVCSAPCFGSWVYIPLDVLVTQSSDIVVGTLTSTVAHTRDDPDAAEATILVREVLAGSLKPGARIRLRWTNPAGSVGMSTNLEHQRHQGKPRLWLLERGRRGTFRADYPGRVLEPSQKAEVLEALRTLPLHVTIAPYTRIGEPVVATLVFRNAGKTPRRIPEFRSVGGRLRLGRGVTLTLSRWQDGRSVPLRPVKGRVLAASSPGTRVVAPHAEHSTQVNLAEVYGLRTPGFYWLSFQRDAYPRIRHSTFEVLTPEQYERRMRNRATHR